MHNDEVQNDIISLILHIDSEKAEPWPILIEDYNGRTHEIIFNPWGYSFLWKFKVFPRQAASIEWRMVQVSGPSCGAAKVLFTVNGDRF